MFLGKNPIKKNQKNTYTGFWGRWFCIRGTWPLLYQIQGHLKIKLQKIRQKIQKNTYIGFWGYNGDQRTSDSKSATPKTYVCIFLDFSQWPRPGSLRSGIKRTARPGSDLAAWLPVRTPSGAAFHHQSGPWCGDSCPGFRKKKKCGDHLSKFHSVRFH